MAEPAYILLAGSGVSEAHEVIRRITLQAEREGCGFAKALAGEPEILALIGSKLADLGLVSCPGDALLFFEKPEAYCGLAAKKARAVAVKYRLIMEEREQGAMGAQSSPPGPAPACKGGTNVC